MIRKAVTIILIVLALCVTTVSAEAYLSDYAAQNVLMLHMNGTHGAQVFVDSTGKAVTVNNVSGYPYTSTNKPAFGNATGYRSGTGTTDSYLTLADSSDWSMGSGDFTILLWVNPSVLDGANSNILLGQADSTPSAASRQNQITITSTKVLNYDYWNSSAGRNTVASTTAMVTEAWYQVVVIRSGNTLTMYQNGVSVATANMTGVTLQDASGVMGVWAAGAYDGSRGQAYLDEVAIWKGVAIPISELYPQWVQVGEDYTAPTDIVTNFSANVTTGGTPKDVGFTDESTGTPNEWYWVYGDEIYGDNWSEATAAASWAAREDFGFLTAKNKDIILIGGIASGTVKGDVWKSSDNGATWTQRSNLPVDRYAHDALALPDGDIVLFAGFKGVGAYNDVWKSSDYGFSWVRVNSSAGWTARYGVGSAVTPDGDIFLMGGTYWPGGTETYFNDTWKSSDEGSTWTQVNASSGWVKRQYPSSVALSDGTILLMGGFGSAGGTVTGGTYRNDTWSSTDDGATWTLVNASCGWAARTTFVAVAMPDDSIIISGGWANPTYFNDTWRSADKGATWTQIDTGPGWVSRGFAQGTLASNGSIILAGGYNGADLNDTQIFQPYSVGTQNTTHTYTTGLYDVALLSSSSNRWNQTIKLDYINITDIIAPIAAFVGSPLFGLRPLEVQFTDASTEEPTSWLWDFGDGETSTDQNPLHNFQDGGLYTISLQATNLAGSDYENKTDYIEVLWRWSTFLPKKSKDLFIS